MRNQDVGIWVLLLGILTCFAAILIKIWDGKRKYKYNQTVDGTVVGYKWHNTNSVKYPCAVVEYVVDGKKYRCQQRYATVHYHGLKSAKYDWEIDEHYGLHRYDTTRCENHVNLTTDRFPVNSTIKVHYIADHPKKAYCGALQSLKLLWILLGCTGLGYGVVGILLMTVFG